MSPIVVRSTIIAALGGLLFGFDTAVISGTTGALQNVFQLTEWQLGFTVAIALFGTIFGAAIVQYPSNSWGRKPTLIAIAALYFISAIGSAFPWDWTSFLFFRFIGGLGVGGASVVSPLYTAEIAPAKHRGLLVAVVQFNIVFGILLAFFSNYVIAAMQFGANEWRWMFGIEAIPAAAFFFLLLLNPESPRWLLTRGKEERARKTLFLFGGNEDSVQSDMTVIREAIESERTNGTSRFFCWQYRFPIFLAICMAAFNQLSGINAILYYAPKVFTIAGASKEMAMFFPVIIGLTNLVFTMAAMFVIDSFGRRTLMLVGSIGYILSLGVVGATFSIFSAEFDQSIRNVALADATNAVNTSQLAYDNAPPEGKAFREEILAEAKQQLIEAKEAAGDGSENKVPMTGILLVLGGLMLFIASHAFGQGACIWVFIGEIFPNSVRAQGQALGSFVHWVLCAAVSQLFPPMLALLGPSIIFYVFSGFMVLQFLWVIGIMPETKQVPLEEMQKRLGIT